MSNLDPFTQKLLQRTQARKEARLKRQPSGDSTSSAEGTPAKIISCDKLVKCTTPPRIPLSERNMSEAAEPSGTSITKKRQSSENHDCSLEKRSKPDIIQEDSVEKVARDSGVTSPVQKVTVKASIQESPKHNVKLKSSLASRLNRLNQQYTEQFQVDVEEEKRKQEAENVWEERRKEHLKQQEKERAQVIQERIFGKDYTKQKEEEKLNQLREKYLGDSPRYSKPSSPAVTFKQTEMVKTLCPNSESKSPSKGKMKVGVDAMKDKVSEKVYQNGNNEGVKEGSVDQNGTNKGVKEGNVDVGVNAEDTKMNGGLYLSDKKDTNKGPLKYQVPGTTVSGSLRRNNGDDTDEKLSSGGVKDKKSLFEEKMKQERNARDKEREADEWLRTKGSRNSVILSNGVSNRQSCKSKEKLGCGNRYASENDAITNLETVKASNCDTVNHTEVKSSITSCNSELTKEVTEVVGTTPKSSKDIQVDATSAVAEPQSAMHVDPIVSTSSSQVETPVKNYTGEISSPQPVDCTDDTVYSDSQAFDVSAILAIAAHREEAQSHLKPERLHPNRCSTMKVEPFHLVETLPELNMTPIKNESEDEEVLSEFAKAIKNKGKSIKGPNLGRKLEAIDKKTKPINEYVPPEVDKENADDNKTPTNVDKAYEAKSNKKQPEKPPRSSKKQHEKTETKHLNVGTHTETPTGRTGHKNKKEKHLSAGFEEDTIGVIVRPSENITRKKMRKSSSFSEGLGSTPVKSGYHREMSERYNACVSSDLPDMVNSKNQQIQNLLEEAAFQQNIVLQASQALNVAEYSNEDKSNSPEVIEGERLLLLATERRTVCLEEVKSLKGDFDPSQFKDKESIPPCKATIGLTDIRLPLHQEFVSSIKARKLEIGIFHFVVIISIGNKNVYSTKVVSCYDDLEDCTLVVNNNIVMKNIHHDFTMVIKVFGMHNGRNTDQISKLKKNSTNSQSPGNLKNLFSKKNKEEEHAYHASPQTVFRTSNFKLVGETKVNLSLLGNGLIKYALTKVPSKCPLEGCIQMRASCKPEFSACVTGFLTILEDVGGYTAWNRRWCVMKDSRILYWRYPDDEKDKEPMGNIDLRYCADKVVKLLSRDICARPHTFELTLKRPSSPTDTTNLITTIEGKVTRIKYWVCCDNKEDRITWMDTVNKQLSDSRAWRLKKISLKSPCSPQQV